MKRIVTVEELKRRLYLFEHQEVVLTGRTAIKDRGRRTRILFEIRPHNPNDPNQHKQWVRLDDLYEVRPSHRTFHTSEDLVDAVRRVVQQTEKNKNEPN